MSQGVVTVRALARNLRLWRYNWLQFIVEAGIALITRRLG